jgi:hypothetical protein
MSGSDDDEPSSWGGENSEPLIPPASKVYSHENYDNDNNFLDKYLTTLTSILLTLKTGR